MLKIKFIDNLSTGHQYTIKNLQTIRNFTFIEEDLDQFEKIKSILDKKNFNIVFHFAASIVVSESVTNPLKYYMNNTVNTANLIQCAVDRVI
jgi:UDP-glucose 4-epimerase